MASPIFAALLDDVQQQARSFFKKYLQKQEANVQPAAGFLDAADFDLLFDQNLALAAGETQQDQAAQAADEVGRGISTLPASSG